MSIFKRLKKWNEARGLIAKGFVHKNEARFILEEILESFGVHDKKTSKFYAESIASSASTTTTEEKVDAFADIIVFATGAIYKLGYDTDKVMEEVFKEINSRKGTLVDGKFEKDLSVSVYKAKLSECKLK